MKITYTSLKRILGVSAIVLSLLIAFFPRFSYADNPNDGNCGENVIWTIDGSKTLTIKIDPSAPSTANFDMTDYSPSNPNPWIGKDIHNVVIEEGVTHIGTYAFQGCSMEAVTIPASAGGSINAKPTILVVDDNAMTLRSMKGLLEDDYNVMVAN